HRTISGAAAVRDFGANVLVLDDGFQVWKLHRDLDIVLVDASRPVDNGRTLPAGKLREPVSALRRAHCVLATGAPGDLDGIRRLTSASVFSGRSVPAGLLVAGEEHHPEAAREKKVMALSSIASYAAFEETVKSLGAITTVAERYPDHHPYFPEDIRYLNRRAEETGAEWIVTTEKDAVKLDAAQFALPLVVLRVSFRPDDEKGLWDLVESFIR
ncbi:MAG: tetraacyldisaccharide 4'-kinase, partial [Armatimonadota bacterium]